MISFRFHVVSITAIFLAIAIGVVVGSTYVDGAVVDALRNRIDTVSNNLDTRKAENDRLESQLGGANDYIEVSADFAVTDRLTDVPVLLVATRGVDEGSVEDLALKVRKAGAQLPGVVWLEAKWSLGSDDDRAALADLVGARPAASAEALWSGAWEAIVTELTTVAPEAVDTPAGDEADPSATTTTTTPPEVPTSVLLALEAGGFITVDTLDDASATLSDLAGASPRVLVVTGSRAEAELVPMLTTLVEAPAQGGLATVVADVHVEAPEAPGRGDALAAALSQELRDLIVLVDDADRPEGRVGAVLALAALADGQIAGLHYGYGDGADGVLPPWSAP